MSLFVKGTQRKEVAVSATTKIIQPFLTPVMSAYDADRGRRMHLFPLFNSNLRVGVDLRQHIRLGYPQLLELFDLFQPSFLITSILSFSLDVPTFLLSYLFLIGLVNVQDLSMILTSTKI